MELNKIIIGMLATMIIVFGFVFFIAEGVDKYNPSTIPATYTTTFANITSSMSELSSISNQTDAQSSIVGSGSSNILTDFLGFFFGQAYKAGKTLIGGVKILNVFVNTGIDSTIGPNPMGSIVKSALLTMIVVLILAIILHFAIKSDRL